MTTQPAPAGVGGRIPPRTAIGLVMDPRDELVRRLVRVLRRVRSRLSQEFPERPLV